MYVQRILIEQIIKLFTEKPEYRDNHYGTIEYIVSNHYSDEYGKSVKADFKLMTDISRGFRYIQQFEPTLRGKTWIQRQWKAGEISREEYERQTEMSEEIKSVMKQMKIDF